MELCGNANLSEECHMELCGNANLSEECHMGLCGSCLCTCSELASWN
jgi:hypothetical protein